MMRVTNERFDVKKKIEILTATKELIKTKDRWTRFAYARDRENSQIEYFGKGSKPCCFCIMGAVVYCIYQEGYTMHIGGEIAKNMNLREIFQELQITAKDLYGRSKSRSTWNISDFNDHNKTTHKEILRVISKTIVRLKQRRL